MSQTRDVLVRRFVCKKSVEETMLELQARKAKIAAAAMDGGREERGGKEGGGQSGQRLRMEDLALCFDQ